MKTSNNKILITGGATGIGLGLTERFIREDTVIICGTELTFGFSEAMTKAGPKTCKRLLPG